MSEDPRDAKLRRRAQHLGLRMVVCSGVVRLLDEEGAVVASGDLTAIDDYLAQRYTRRPGPAPGQRRRAAPAGWEAMIDDYLRTLRAGGQREKTIALRRVHLENMADGIGCPPQAVTGEQLVDWFGRQMHWAIETRRGYRSATQGFFSWAYRAGKVPTYLGDALPKVRHHTPPPRPAPDEAWSAALLAADLRVTLMLRLAAEAGLRCAEVAQVHTRDLIEQVGGASLLVHGKRGKERVVPLNEGLAQLLRQGAAGHTPGAPCDGWLFPGQYGDHLTPPWVCVLVARTLPDGLTMHTLRHRFATRVYRGSRNLRAVQVLMGHASIATTERYLAVDDDEIRAAMMSAL